MSLLLEALKKAELAKQAAKEPQPADGALPFTRDQLPDISQPMEIHSDDLGTAAAAPPPQRAQKPVLELALEEEPRAAPAASPQRTAPAAASYAPPAEDAPYSPSGESAERKQAQQLFDAKELDVNPRKPFYITLGALGVFALGTIAYFWYQLQPRSVAMVPASSAPAGPPPAAPAPAAPAVAPNTQAVTTVTPPVGTQAAEPAAPVQRAAPAGAAPAAPKPAPPKAVFARSDAAARPAGDAQAAQPGAARRQQSAIAITPASAQPDPVLEGAYQAYNAGDLARAREDYRQVLRANPASRDALLGLAAVETQEKRYDAAERNYARLLELDPRDAHAQAGLIGLRGQVDPQAAESRLKSMIASQPEASFLNFTLGNQYAAQGRWGEAQQAYFQAYAGDPGHPDFACNLAISLDRLHQTKAALEYYRRALALAADRPASFDKAQIAKRVLQLER